MKMRCGTEPKDADGVIYVDDEEGSTRSLAGWAIYRRAASQLPWVSLKIARVGRGKGATNYWVGWNVNSRCFNRCRDVPRMSAGMRKELEDIMLTVYPHLTEQELVDELARVRLLA